LNQAARLRVEQGRATPTSETPSERQRLDKWLWHARVVKARASAAALVTSGHVRINGVRETSPGHGVKTGDVLTIALDRSVRVLKIVGFAERRGDANSARVLYDELSQRT
jgi:ribosome-associated heat shock protein Hsp15